MSNDSFQFSFIIQLFDNADSIQDTIASVIAHTISRMGVIVVDNASKAMIGYYRRRRTS